MAIAQRPATVGGDYVEREWATLCADEGVEQAWLVVYPRSRPCTGLYQLGELTDLEDTFASGAFAT